MNFVSKIFLTGSALLLVLVVIVFLEEWAVSAASPQIPSATKLSISTRELVQGENTNISVSARLTDGDQPLGNQPVEFVVAATFFGDRQVNLGTVVTDATGNASILYTPRWDGNHIITARFKGDENHPQAEVTKNITFSGPVPQYQPESVGLTLVREWATPLIGLGIVVFWLFLIFVIIRTLRGISHARSRILIESQYKLYKQFGNVVYQKRSSRN